MALPTNSIAIWTINEDLTGTFDVRYGRPTAHGARCFAHGIGLDSGLRNTSRAAQVAETILPIYGMNRDVRFPDFQ